MITKTITKRGVQTTHQKITDYTVNLVRGDIIAQIGSYTSAGASLTEFIGDLDQLIIPLNDTNTPDMNYIESQMLLDPRWQGGTK